MYDLSPKAEIIAQDDAQAVAVLSADGELLVEIPLRRGVTRGREILRYIPAGGSVQVTEGATVLAPGSKLFMLRTDEHADSAANPDIQPRQVSETEKRLEAQLRRSQAQTARMIAELSARIGVPAAREAAQVVATPAPVEPEIPSQSPQVEQEAQAE